MIQKSHYGCEGNEISMSEVLGLPQSLQQFLTAMDSN